jgi:diacylglycerol kinase (ATP)
VSRRLRVIWNEGAGSKGGIPTNRVDEVSLRELLGRHHIDGELVASGSVEEAQRATRDAVDQGLDGVVAAGGDGTVGSVATVLLDTGVPLGILPMGSVMNMARMLGIPRDLDEAAAIVASAPARRVDVGEAGGEPFYETASVGMNARIFQQVQQADEGDYTGLLRAVRTAFRYRPAHMILSLDEGVVRSRALMVTASNGPYTGAGFTVAPDARLDDGRLDVTLFRHFSKLDLIRHFAAIAFGRRAYSPHVRTYRSSRVRVEGHSALPARADSRDLGTTPVEFRVRPGALLVFAPPRGTVEGAA